MIKPLVVSFYLCVVLSVSFAKPYLGNGIKIGEVYQDRATVWARLTSVKAGDSLTYEDPAPGEGGDAVVLYRENGVRSRWIRSETRSALKENDHVVQFDLVGLKPGTEYELKVNVFSKNGRISASAKGHFCTAFAAEKAETVRGVVVTCQGIGTIDDAKLGHKAYADMLKLNPNFFVHTGDIVYYDKDYENIHPLSKTVEQARERWNRMFSFRWNKDFHSKVSSYFLKDDHDTLKNDSYPGQTYGELSFERGLEIFNEQTPQGDLPYRTIRWGQDLQIWLLEGRDFRSPNGAPDEPKKTMLGFEQKAWLKRTIKESGATFKLVISPSPIVGPDKAGKKDNLSNDVFKTEGEEIREFLSQQEDLFVVCGDRHWQYASKDAETGLLEFGCGPINNEHAKIGGNPGKMDEHIYFGGGKGGYLLFEVSRKAGIPKIEFKWFANSDGKKASIGELNYSMAFEASSDWKK
ncbi:alkaline phosphatase D family protein [Puniceicoccaceae bacterium K14]|nr:alkaline phosphatase D family protein [Puniceicoccaceae bacterium K14]